MLTYVYRCPKCSREIELNRRFDPGSSEAPECQHCQVTMVRSWNDTAIIFKGKGFYTTDNRKGRGEQE